LYEQICSNPQSLKPAKDKKHNREKKRGNEKEKNLPLAHIMHAPKSHPIEVTKDMIECMITRFNQKHFQKQLPNIAVWKELNRSVSGSYFTKLQEH
jgi:hypothetical protein